MATSGNIYQSPIDRDIFEMGKLEGRLEGRVDLICKMLSVRYGSTSEVMRLVILGLQEEHVDGIAQFLMTAKPLKEVMESVRRRARGPGLKASTAASRGCGASGAQ